MVIWTAWVGDDCLITWRTVENFLDGRGLRWNLEERVQSYTHPLWLSLLAVVRAAGAPIYGGTLGLSFALTGLTALAIVRAPERRGSGAVALLLLAGSRAFVDYSTSGLEGPLTHLLIVWLWLAHERKPEGLAIGLLVSALVLNRLDNGLLVAPLLAMSLARDVRERAWLRWPLGLTPVAAWLGFATLYYGYPFPNTGPAKLLVPTARADLLEQGITYVRLSAELDPLGAVLVPTGLLLAGWVGSRTVRCLALGAVLSLGYTVWIGGDFMAGRFFTPSILIAALAVEESLRGLPARRVLGVAPVAAALMVVAPTSPARSPRDLGQEPDWDITGPIDERSFYFAGSGLFRSPKGGPAIPLPPHERIGPPALVVGGGGLAALSEPADTHMVDPMALTDPFLARLLPDGPGPFRAGHAARQVPHGYLETLRTGRNLLVHPAHADLWEDVALASRRPLFSAGRLGAIVRLLSTEPVPSAAELPSSHPPGAEWPAPRRRE